MASSEEAVAVAGATSIPIAADESVASRAEAERAVAMGAWSLTGVKLSKVGGPEAAIEIAEVIPTYVTSALDGAGRGRTGRLLSDDAWLARKETMLPSADDDRFVESLMRRARAWHRTHRGSRRHASALITNRGLRVCEAGGIGILLYCRRKFGSAVIPRERALSAGPSSRGG